MRFFALTLCGATLASCTLKNEAQPESGPFELAVGMAGDDCFIEVEGERRETDFILPAAKASGATWALLSAAPDIPYRCVGGIIFELQRAGIQRVEFKPEGGAL